MFISEKVLMCLWTNFNICFIRWQRNQTICWGRTQEVFEITGRSCPRAYLLFLYYSSNKGRSSCVLWLVGTRTQLCCGGGGNTSGPHWRQVSHWKAGDAESVCSGSVPIAVRGSSHRLPRHHMETPSVSTRFPLHWIFMLRVVTIVFKCLVYSSVCVCVCVGTQWSVL